MMVETSNYSKDSIYFLVRLYFYLSLEVKVKTSSDGSYFLSRFSIDCKNISAGGFELDIKISIFENKHTILHICDEVYNELGVINLHSFEIFD